mgnify:CR=1 FL=1
MTLKLISTINGLPLGKLVALNFHDFYLILFLSPMKRLIKGILVITALGTVSSWTACERCTTCNRYDLALDSTMTSEVCNDHPKVYDDQIRIYEKNGWTCADED